ncbi:PAS domain S-box protein [Acidihalobacter prosperus]|uniref:histidine kinase n=1 Tax=Acidihalobacter prosperus TaxID=160660 RepID=A0A1A6C7L9_9GAMM|nr:hypothetical protein Thpro_020279 [Acidihalobacter prosperus]
MSDEREREGYAPSGAMPAPMPTNEADRLEALRRYAVLDTPPESDLDEIAALASEVCETPIALISLVDEHRQWFKSRLGLDASETPRDLAFCAHAILGDSIFEVPNALEDPRFRFNPLVVGAPDIRFYAGMVLTTSDGFNLGTLCVIDREPKRLTERQRGILERLGRQVSRMLALRVTLRHYAEQAAFQEALLSSAGAAIIACTPDGRISRFNAAAEAMLGYRARDVIGRIATDLLLPEDRRAAANLADYGCFGVWLNAVDQAHDNSEVLVEAQYRHADGHEVPVLLSITPILDTEGRSVGQLGVAQGLSQLKQVQDRLGRQQRALRTLNEIAAHPSDDVRSQLSHALELGAVYLGMSYGIISRIVDDDFEVWAQVSPGGELHEGQHFPLGDTYCSLVVGGSDVLAIAHMSASSYADHACHATFRMESYIGIPVWVEGQIFGALSFSSHETKADGFDEADRDFLRLFSRWLGSILALQREQAVRDDLLGRLQKLSEHVPGVVYQYLQRADGTSCFPYASEGIADIYGVRPDDVREDASPVFAVLHEADVPEIIASIESSANDLTTWQAEYRVDHPQRGTLWVEGRATPQKLPDGGVLWHGVITDVTARKTARDALERERQRLSSIIEGTDAGTWEWNVATGRTVFNERWAQMLGYRLEELMPTSTQTWKTLIHPDDRAQAEQLLDAHFQGQTPFYDAEYRMRHKDGRWLWMHTRGRVVSWLKPGRPQMMYGIYTDITASREQAAEIRKARAFLQAVIDSSTGVSVIATDTDGQITLFNSGAERLLGYRADEMVGLRTPAAFHLESEVRARGEALSREHDREIQGFEVFVAEAREGAAETRQWTYVHKNGNHRQVRLTVTAIRDERGQLNGFLGIATDITEFMEASRALQASEQRFRGMVANLPGVVYRTEGDDARQVRYISEEIEQLLGFPAERFLRPGGSGWRYFIHPDDCDETARALEKLRRGESYEFNYRLRHADGHYLWVSEKARGVLNDSGRLQWIDGFVWDVTERRAIAEELKLSQKRFSGAFATAPLGMALVSLQGQWLEVNDKLCEILGYTREELLLTDFQHITHPEDLDTDLAYVDQLLRGDIASYQMDKRYLHRNGRVIWASLSVSLVRDSTGKPVHFVSQIEDFTSRKLAEEAMQTSERKLAALYRFSPVGIALHRFEDGRFVEANPELCRMLGYEEEQLTVLGIGDVTYFENNDGRDDQMAALRERGVYGPGQVEFVRQDGRRIPALLGSTLIEGAHGEKRVWSIVQDISARVLAEQKSVERERFVQAIIDNVVDGILTINDTGRIQSFNHAAESIFGYVVNEVLDRDVPDLFSPGDGVTFADELQAYRMTGMPMALHREIEGIRRDDTRFPMELSLSEIHENGRVRFVAVVRDITERRNAERLKNEFVATVSHELRTPLTSISGALGLLASDALIQSPDKARSLIEIAHNNSTRLTLLINDLLDMEKIAAGKMHFDMRVHRLWSLVNAAVESNQNYAQQHEVELILSGQIQDAWVCVDAQRFQQILANFLSNASKFSPPGGDVHIVVRRFDDTHWRVEVRDQGPGVPLKFQERLFQKFAQADGSSARPKGGTGLGLAITKEMAERMGGRVGYESGGDRGACFYIDLPIVPEVREVGERQGARFVPEHDGDESDLDWVLVVEDDSETAVRVGMALRDAGYAADLCFRGDEAIERLAVRHYAAIMLDLMLPDMSGSETLDKLSAAARDEAGARIPIYVMSQLDAEQVGSWGDIVLAGWFEKPVDTAQMIAALRRLSSSRDASDQNPT